MRVRRRPDRWSDQHPLLARLLGVVVGSVVGGAVAAGLLTHTAPSPEGPDGEVVMVAPPPPVVDPELAANVQHCQKVAETLGDVGRVVTANDSLSDDEVLQELDHAEDRMTRRMEVPSPCLATTFDDIHETLGELRQAIRADTGVRAALDDTLDLIRTVEQQCREMISSAEESERPAPP